MTPTPTWRERAATLSIDGRALIHGERVAASSELDKHSPIDGRRLGAFARCGAAEVDASVRSARSAQPAWAALAPGARKLLLQRFAEQVLAAKDELALLDCLDMGKPIRHALQVDVPAAARCIAWYGEAIDKVYGEVAPTAANALALVTREPVGVVGCITPWNYPLIMAAWKIAPALAAGNTVVLKPSERAPFSCLRLGELALAAGIPPGVLNVVPGLGGEAGELLALHEDVDALGFTGSTRVGALMLGYSGRSNLKRVFNELGGKSAFVVFADANLEKAAAACAGAMFFNQGQSCNAPSRVLVQDAVAERFVALLAEQARKWQPADPLDPGTRLGAMVDAAQLQTVLGYVASGQQEGAQLVLGGQAAQPVTGGSYMQPTLFDATAPSMRICREEIFGPVTAVQRFTDEADAVQRANATRYGLQAGLWTANLGRAHRVARALQAGTVHVNSYDEDDMTVPFGGVKQSGNGRDKSLHALDKYSELKTTWMRLDD